MNAIKPYTNLDTLYVLKGDFLNTLKIPGPFINRRLYRINSFPVLPEMIYGNNGDNVKASLNNNVDLTKGYVIENNKLCGDTVYVNIDVR